MVIEKIIGDLESNMTLENEEAKRKLVELLSQSESSPVSVNMPPIPTYHFPTDKEQWVVKFMLDYFFTTGSQRILEVLVKAQAPHDGYIFDKLDDCLKQSQHRVQSLQVFCFIVRHHPTWLYKIEKHRLIKSVFKLMTVSLWVFTILSELSITSISLAAREGDSSADERPVVHNYSAADHTEFCAQLS